MKSSPKLGDLVAFLIDGSASLDSVSRFLVQNTFSTLEPTAIFLAFAKPDGSMAVSAGFGFNPDANPDIYGRSLRSKALVDEAFRHNKIVLGGNFREFDFSHPQQVRHLFPNGFEDSLAIPMSFLGVMVVCFKKKLQLTPKTEIFLRGAGSILALHAARLNAEFSRKVPQEPVSLAEKRSELTSRQLVILNSLVHGSTNREIANDLDFSESLIRHETVEIYRKLNVSGRRELLEQEDLAEPVELHAIN